MDLIPRQAVIDTVKDWIMSEEFHYTNATYYVEKRINALPTVQPDEELRQENENLKNQIRKIYQERIDELKRNGILDSGYSDDVGGITWTI